jgi:integrase
MPRRPAKRLGRRDFGTIKPDGTPSAPRFSAVWWEGNRQRRRRGFDTRTEAEEFLARVRVELADGSREIGDPIVTPGITVKHAIEAYGRHLDEKGLKPGPNAERLRRLQSFFTDEALLLSEPTTSSCASYYEALRTRISPTTKRTYSVDTHRNTLAEARMLGKWCVTKRWLRSNPAEGIEGKGKRRHGKPQLRIDEARRWLAKAEELAEGGDVGAIAAMMTLLLGVRASEIVSRVVRDLDDDGRLLWIPDSNRGWQADLASTGRSALPHAAAGQRAEGGGTPVRGALARLAARVGPEDLRARRRAEGHRARNARPTLDARDGGRGNRSRRCRCTRPRTCQYDGPELRQARGRGWCSTTANVEGSGGRCRALTPTAELHWLFKLRSASKTAKARRFLRDPAQICTVSVDSCR